MNQFGHSRLNWETAEIPMYEHWYEPDINIFNSIHNESSLFRKVRKIIQMNAIIKPDFIRPLCLPQPTH